MAASGRHALPASPAAGHPDQCVRGAAAELRQRAHAQRTRGVWASSHERCAVLRSLGCLDRRARLHRGLASWLQAAGACSARQKRRALRQTRALASCASRALCGLRLTRRPAAPRRTCRSRHSAGASCARPALRRACAERDSDAALHPHPSRLASPTARGSSRRRLQQATLPYLVRLNLFALGFHYIPISGKAAPRKEAPIVVCNHQARVVIESRRAPSLRQCACCVLAGLSGHLALPVALSAGWRVCC